MARKRMLAPSFWTDPHVAKLSREERLMFLGCISAADDEGRLLGSSAFLRAQIFPYDDDLAVEDVQKMRDRVLDLEKNLILYEVDGVEYMAFLKWRRYQKPSHPTPSHLPPPPNMSNSGDIPEFLAKGSRNVRSQVRLGKDSIGQEQPEVVVPEDFPERKKTISLYARAYAGIPSELNLSEIELLAEKWGDSVVQSAIREAGRGPNNRPSADYIEGIIYRWWEEGKVKPIISEQEYEQAQKRISRIPGAEGS